MSRRLRAVLWPAEINRADQPYNWLLSESLRRAGVVVEEFSVRRALGRPDVWHLHWPDSILNDPVMLRAVKNVLGLALALWFARRRGTAIVWTAHNLASHEGRYARLERLFWSSFSRSVDGVISLSESALRAATERFPVIALRPTAVIPIGHYRGVYPDEVTQVEARDRLGLPAVSRVIAFVGQVRPYKGVTELLAQFRTLPAQDLRLLIAGRPRSAAFQKAVEAAAAGDPRIRLELAFIPDADLQLYLRAADLVVLPFAQILNSASAVLALSFDRPVLMPALGSLSELKEAIGDRWIRLYEGELTARELEAAIAWAAVPDRGPAPLQALEWSGIGERTAKVYEAVRAWVDRGRRS